MSEKQDENAPETEKRTLLRRTSYNKTGVKKIKSEVVSWVLTLIVAVGAGLLIRTFLIEPVRIEGPSMMTTLIEGELTVLDKITYKVSDPKHGDVINFYCEALDDRLVKRVIGVPGDSVKIVNGKVIRNGMELYEPYAQPNNPNENMDEITLGTDEYFVMGDNRTQSTDSRSERVGKISKDKFYGKVIAVVWPVNKLHFGAFD